jgi:nitroreductase
MEPGTKPGTEPDIELGEAIRTTGAVREFDARAVSDADLAEVLDDARFAPSGGNRQPWRVAVIKDVELRRRLAALMQPVWDEYVSASRGGEVPFNSVDYAGHPHPPHAPNALLDDIETIPVMLAIAADLRRIVATDVGLDRPAIVPGASIYPFCWNLLLAARRRGLGGVMTTLLSRAEGQAAPLLRLPDDHALAAVVFLGHPVHRPTKLSRRPVGEFASVDTFEGTALV